jgi:hypothetical protein
MKGKMIVIGTDAKGPGITQLTGPPSLEQLSAAVQGHIEVVPGFNNYDSFECVAFCNEEGKLKNLPPNFFAQYLWELAMGRPIPEDFLVGPIAIIIGDAELLRSL